MHIIRVACFACFACCRVTLASSYPDSGFQIQISDSGSGFSQIMCDCTVRLHGWDLDSNRDRGGRDRVRKGLSTLALIFLHAALYIHVVQGMNGNKY